MRGSEVGNPHRDDAAKACSAACPFALWCAPCWELLSIDLVLDALGRVAVLAPFSIAGTSNPEPHGRDFVFQKNLFPSAWHGSGLAAP